MATVQLSKPQTTQFPSTPTTSSLKDLDLQDPLTRQTLMDTLGIEKPKPKVGLFGRLTGLLDAFRFTDDIRTAQKEGVGKGVLDFVSDPFKKIGTAITGTDYSNKYDEQGGAEILKDMGIQHGVLKNVGGFVLDVLADPTTYVTLGTGAGAKIITGGGVKALTKSGGKLFQKSIQEFGEELAEKGAKEIGERLLQEGITTINGKTVNEALQTLGKLGGTTMPEIAEELAKKKLLKFADKGVDVWKTLPKSETDKLIQQVVKDGVFDEGGFKFAGKTLFKPTAQQEKILGTYFDPISSAVEGAKNVPILKNIVEGVEQGGKNAVSNIFDTVRKAFDTDYAFTGGDKRFEALNLFRGMMKDRIAGAKDTVVDKIKSQYDELQNLIKEGVVDENDVGDLRFILEDTPIEKVYKLPEETQQRIFNLLESKSGGDINFADAMKQVSELESTVKSGKQSILDEKIGEIVRDFDVAEAGKRIGIEDPNSYDLSFIGQKSTFPDWIPDGYREKKILDQVSEAFRKNKPPKNKKASELYDMVLDRAKSNITNEDISGIGLDVAYKELKNLKQQFNIPKGADTLISDMAQIKNPELRRITSEMLDTIKEGTESLLNVGALEGESVANYIMREVLETPSGKIIDEGKGLFGQFGSSVKSQLDPRKAIQQKKRFYDYLADLEAAGGIAKTTKGTAKEKLANLMEALAKGEMQVTAAKEFEGFAKQIINGDILDGYGNKLYSEIDDILQTEPELFKGYEAAIQQFKNSRGKIVPPSLKDKLENLGYKQIKGKGNKVIPMFENAWFDPDSYEVMSKFHKQFFNDEATNELVKMYDKINRMFKTSQTVWFPAFHVRNLFSNVFGNFMAGVDNPKVYMQGMDIQKYANAIEKGSDDVIEKLGKKKIGGNTIADLYNIAKNNGVIGNNFYSDLSEDLIKNPTKLSRANPLSQDFILTDKLGKVGSLTEDNGRLALFLDRVSKGDDFRSAALKVKEVLFDYGDLTDFEKNIMRRFVPYYTWARKNAELQMKYILTQPGKYSAMLKGFDEIQDAFGNVSEEDMAALPDWAKEGVGFVTGGNGAASVIKQFGLPHEAFQQLLETNPMNTLSVPIKTGIELGTGQNIFKGKAILDDTNGKQYRNLPQFIKDRIGYREEKRKTKDGEEYTVYYVDPMAKYWVSTFLGRTMSESTKISTIGDTGNVGADLLNLFTGIKKYDFNITEEEEKRNREQAKELYDILLSMGKAREYTNTYIPADQKKDILSMMGQ